jgi:hypothetical protein
MVKSDILLLTALVLLLFGSYLDHYTLNYYIFGRIIMSIAMLMWFIYAVLYWKPLKKDPPNK